MSSGVEVTAQTAYGIVDQPNEQMIFDDEVVAETTSGYKIWASRVICHNREGVMDSSEPVKINGPTGRLKAAGFHITDKGESILFTGQTDTTVTSKDGDIRIQSDDGLLIEQVPQTITAIQNVRVTQPDKVVTADKMILFYLTKEQDPNNRILKIETIGNVVASSEGYKITGDHGIYDPQKGTIVMTDNVTLFQGENQISGKTATLNLATGENTLVPDEKADSPTGRIKGRLLPTELKGMKK
jgi:lipopolysaccharide transport protein LptA